MFLFLDINSEYNSTSHSCTSKSGYKLSYCENVCIDEDTINVIDIDEAYSEKEEIVTNTSENTVEIESEKEQTEKNISEENAQIESENELMNSFSFLSISLFLLIKYKKTFKLVIKYLFCF